MESILQMPNKNAITNYNKLMLQYMNLKGGGIMSCNNTLFSTDPGAIKPG